MPTPQLIRPCLWFDGQAEDAARFYTSIFKNSRVGATTRYGEAGHDVHGREAGSVMTVDFELDGQAFTALNGGPHFKFNEALSLQILCGTQKEIDYYWDKLSEGGDPSAQQCGWLKDKFGLSWQVIYSETAKIFADAGSPGAERAMDALLEMKKIDVATLEEAAHEGKRSHPRARAS